MSTTTTDPKLQETAERFHMAMAEAGYPDVSVYVEDGHVEVSYPCSLKHNTKEFQHAFWMASKLSSPDEPIACFDCWYASIHHHTDQCVDCNDGTTCPHV